MLHPLYLVRHGQSEWNLRRLTQGQTPHPRLTGLGREEARAAALLVQADLGRLAAQGLGAQVGTVVTSDLVRATETAEILVDVLGGELRRDSRLREQHLGALEGRGYQETWAAAELHDWSDPDLPVAGGESLRQVHDRMAEAIAAVDRSAVTVLVTHGDAIRAAVAHLTGAEPHLAPWVEVPNGAVVRSYDGGVGWLRPWRAGVRGSPPGSGCPEGRGRP